jgi:hypothetical protein
VLGCRLPPSVKMALVAIMSGHFVLLGMSMCRCVVTEFRVLSIGRSFVAGCVESIKYKYYER